MLSGSFGVSGGKCLAISASVRGGGKPSMSADSRCRGVGTIRFRPRAAQVDEVLQRVEPERRAERNREAGDQPAQDRLQSGKIGREDAIDDLRRNRLVWLR